MPRFEVYYDEIGRSSDPTMKWAVVDTEAGHLVQAWALTRDEADYMCEAYNNMGPYAQLPR